MGFNSGFKGLTSSLRDERSVSKLSHFSRKKRAAGTHETGGWKVSRAGLDGMENSKIPTSDSNRTSVN